MANLPKIIPGNISRVLKAPTQSVTDFATLQPHLDAHGFLYASDKEDGIRCITHPVHGPCSQKMLPIPNRHIRKILSAAPLCLDGELIATTKDGRDLSFNDTQSAVMSEDGIPFFQFRVFDCFENIYDPYEERLDHARHLVESRCNWDEARMLYHHACKTIKDIENIEKAALLNGKEGIMLNHSRGWYKEGRSTLNEAYLLKVKRFEDDEAVVIGLEEEMENCNPATQDAGGLQKRSRHAAGLKGKGCVGKLVCIWNDRTIKIASGLTERQKMEWFTFPNRIIGLTVTFKYQKHGMKDLPRMPIFKGIRYD